MSGKPVKYLRPLQRKVVYPAVRSIIDRNDLYPCDKDGNFLSTGTDEAPVAVEVAPAVDETAESEEQVQENRERDALVSRAKQLGIKNYWSKKNGTLLEEIKELEADEAIED